jgi:hypothetical protein
MLNKFIATANVAQSFKPYHVTGVLLLTQHLEAFILKHIPYETNLSVWIFLAQWRAELHLSDETLMVAKDKTETFENERCEDGHSSTG